MKRLCVLLVSIVMSLSAFAIDTDKAFDDPELQARYEKLIAEVRCVTCQNQNIKDSNAFIAADLRREIRRLMEEGKTDDEVVDFLEHDTATLCSTAHARAVRRWPCGLHRSFFCCSVFSGSFAF